MPIISISEIIELNKLLQTSGVLYKVHLRDACGAQSFRLENLDETQSEENAENAKSIIKNYFEKLKTEPVFYIGSNDFSMKKM